jgi:hypothetical protein
MSWKDLDEKPKGGGSSRFVKLESGKTTRFRILDEEPYTTYAHKIVQPDPAKPGEEIFRSIPATTKLDEDYIQQVNGKRYPAVPQFNIRVFEFAKDDKGKDVSEGEIKILQGGVSIFRALRSLYEEHGSLAQFDVTIKTTGEKRDTEYAVTAAPFSLPVDVDALQTKLLQTAELQYENVFPNVTPDDQKKMLAEAKLDVTYDPAAQIAESMSYEEALNQSFTFGKFKGKTVADVMVIDSSYLEWAAGNVTSNDALAAACRVVSNRINGVAPAPALQSGQSTPAATGAPAPTPAPAKATTAKPKAPATDSAEAKSLREKISQKFEDYDAQDIVGKIKEASGGKVKLKDLTVDELTKLAESIAA